MRPSMRTRRAATMALAAMLLSAPAVRAEILDPPKYHKQDLAVYSGTISNKGGEEQVAFRETIQIKGAAWLQLRIGAAHLGERSHITLRSLLDGAVQRHNAATLKEWGLQSAVFNGDAVELTLYTAVGDTGVFVDVTQAIVGEFFGNDDLKTIKTLCGSDSRVASTDARVGRLFFYGCTAWITANASFITAGHCCDFDPDDSGPMVPDGVADISGVVEFNIPQSTPSGTPVAAAPEDQYPITGAYTAWQFPGEGVGPLGDDWCVFAVGANANTGLMPALAQNAFFRLSRATPADGATIRITGCGRDNTPPGTTGNRNSNHGTLQTATGPYQGEGSSGSAWWHSYQTDTEPANSGSPVIRESNNLAIGVHTNGGCQSDGSGANSGTSFERDEFEQFVNDFPSVNTIYVDIGHPEPSNLVGSMFFPTNNVTSGVTLVPANGVLSVVRGTYSDVITITKAMLVQAPVGTVAIGVTPGPNSIEEGPSPEPAMPPQD